MQADTTLSDEITYLLKEINQGDLCAVSKLMELAYNDLREAARIIYAGQRQDTLGPTSVVHEFFIRFSRHAKDNKCHFANRAEFFGFAITLMRNVIADHGRFHKAEKRGGPQRDLSLDGLGDLLKHTPSQSYLLNHVLDKLESTYPEDYRVVCLHFFFEMTWDEIATTVGSSRSTVKRSWRFSKNWLYHHAGQNLEEMGN